MTDIKVDVTPEIHDAILKCFTDNGLVPFTDQALTEAGYHSVIVGIGLPTLFSNNIIFCANPDDRVAADKPAINQEQSK